MNARFSSAVRSPWAVPVTALVAGGIGFGVGFLLGRRTIEETTVVEVIDEEDYDEDSLEAIRQDFEEYKRRKDLEADPQYQALLREEQAIEEANHPDPADIQVEEPVVHQEHIVIAGGDLVLDTTNVFASASVVPWNYEEELKHRDPEGIYVIHKDEFWNEEEGFEQTSLDYYPGDDILVDQLGAPIYNYQLIIGPEHHFGHGSDDPLQYFVRNHQRQCEYEILLQEGLSYTETVLGIQAEEQAEDEDDHLKHSLRKFKGD